MMMALTMMMMTTKIILIIFRNRGRERETVAHNGQKRHIGKCKSNSIKIPNIDVLCAWCTMLFCVVVRFSLCRQHIFHFICLILISLNIKNRNECANIRFYLYRIDALARTHHYHFPIFALILLLSSPVCVRVCSYILAIYDADKRCKRKRDRRSLCVYSSSSSLLAFISANVVVVCISNACARKHTILLLLLYKQRAREKYKIEVC